MKNHFSYEFGRVSYREYDIKNETVLISYETAVAFEGPIQTKDDEK